MKGFKKGGQNSSSYNCYAGGGAAKGVPSMRRRGHPVAAKKALVAPAPSPTPVAGVSAAPALRSLVSGAMGRGPGQVALPQGAAPPLDVAQPKMVKARPPKLADGGFVKRDMAPSEHGRTERNFSSGIKQGNAIGVRSDKGSYGAKVANEIREQGFDDASSYSGDYDYEHIKAGGRYACGGKVKKANKLAAGGMPMPGGPPGGMPPQAMGATPSALPGAPPGPPQGMPPQAMGAPPPIAPPQQGAPPPMPQGVPPQLMPPQAQARMAMAGSPRNGMPGRGGVPVAPRGPMLGRR